MMDLDNDTPTTPLSVDVTPKSILPISSISLPRHKAAAATSNYSSDRQQDDREGRIQEKILTAIFDLPLFIKLFLLVSILLHILQHIPSIHAFCKSYLLFQPATLFSRYLLYTPLTSVLLNSNVFMLLINSVSIIFSFSFISQNHFLSEKKLLKFLAWNTLFGALGSIISWTIAWSITGHENLLEASFPGPTAPLTALTLLLTHFSPETPLLIHKKLRIRHLPGLYMFGLVPITALFVSWEDSVLCFTGLFGGWIVIRYIWSEKRDGWRFTTVFLPEQLRFFRSIPTPAELDLESPPHVSTVPKLSPITDVAVTKNTAKKNRRIRGEQVLLEKMRKKETEPTTTTTATTTTVTKADSPKNLD